MPLNIYFRSQLSHEPSFLDIESLSQGYDA